MKPIITLDRLNVFRQHDGDIEVLLKNGMESDIAVYGSDLDAIWKKITTVLQNLARLEKEFVSKESADRLMSEIELLCDKQAFEEVTKNILARKASLLHVIQDYQLAADQAVRIFRKKYRVLDILDGWNREMYPQTGKLVDDGLSFYAFHGIGLTDDFSGKVVDFDFAYFPEPRHDGFDLGRITKFIRSQAEAYPAYKDPEQIKMEFHALIAGGIIVIPRLECATMLYFFKNTLDLELFD